MVFRKRLLEGEKKLETPAKVDVGTVVSEKLGKIQANYSFWWLFYTNVVRFW